MSDDWTLVRSNTDPEEMTTMADTKRPCMREGAWLIAGNDITRLLHRIGNPMVIALLRSRHHRLLSRTHAVLTVTGCRTGHEYHLPVQYASDGSTIYVVPGGFERKTWWRNLIDPVPVRLRLQGGDVTGIGQAFNGKEDPRVVERALCLYLAKLPHSARVRSVQLDATGAPDPEQLARAVPNEMIVRVALHPTKVG
jgi:hypothetical protein